MIWLIIDKGNETSKSWHGGLLDARQLRWLLGITLGACAIAITVALSFGGGSSNKLAADVNPVHHRASLTDHIRAFLHAWSVDQVSCTGPAGDRSCQVQFTNAYGSWSATLVVKRHDVVSDPGGNANWLCTSACTPLPTTTGLPRTPLGAGNGTTVHDQNSGVVTGTGTGTTPGTYGTGNTGAYGTGNTGTYTPTTPGTYTPTTPGTYTPTTPGTYTPTTPGTYTPTTPGIYTPTTPGTYTPTTPGIYTPTTPGTYTPTTPGTG